MQIPKNVLQVGETDPCRKIYIEDYVHTFLKQHSGGTQDFCLYGRMEKDGEESWYFVYGAVAEDAGWQMMEKRYFAGQSRIGEAALDGGDIWLFFEDGCSVKLDGYFIFYEQNADMQSYLIAVHQNQPVEKSVVVRPRLAGRQREECGRGERIFSGCETAEPGKTEPLPRKIPRRAESLSDLAEKSLQDRGTETRRRSAGTGKGQAEREKVMHAAWERRKTGKGGDRKPHLSGRPALLTLLLLLCAVGVVSINHYQEMEEAGNLFAEAAGRLREEKGLPSSLYGDEEGEEQTGFVVEELRPGEEGESAVLPSLSQNQGDPEESGGPYDSISGGNVGEGEEMEETEELPTQVIQTVSGQEIPLQEPAGVTKEQTAGQQEQAVGQQEQTAGQQEQAAGLSEQPPEGLTAEETAAGANEAYVVQKGDNLAAICRRQYGSTDRLNEIAALNGLENPNHLIPGQKIILPE